MNRPELSAALAALQTHHEEYKVMIDFIRDERDRFFGDLRQSPDTNDVMKIAGSVAALDELLGILRPD